MKFIHLADLHLGKKTFGYDRTEEQADALRQVIDLARCQQADGIFVCGDVYDTSLPNVEAVTLFNDFISQVHALHIPLFVISGNHDSSGRLDFGKNVLKESNIYMTGTYDGTIPYHDLEKGKEKVRIHLLPFIRPANVRYALDTDCRTWQQALQLALEKAQLKQDAANILLSHQFYAGGVISDSEVANVGTLDQVSTEVLEPFDYAALGHLHKPQSITKPQWRYPGTLLKYALGDMSHEKTITLIDTASQQVQVCEIPVKPLRDMVRVEGYFEDILKNTEGVDPETYVYVLLDDPHEIDQAMDRLKDVYPRIVKLEYRRKAITRDSQISTADIRKMKQPRDIIREFYEAQSGESLDPDMDLILENCWEELHAAD